MAYLDTKSLNEDAQTAIYNFASGTIGGYHTLAMKDNAFKNGFELLKNINPIRAIISLGSKLIGGKDKMDRAYFNRYWNIDKVLPQIEKWCKQTGGILVTDKNKNDIIGISSKIFGDKSHEAGYTNTDVANQSIFKRNERLSKFTTALTCIPIKSGNGNYYIYPIFDTKDIREIKVLCYSDRRGPFCKTLTQWKSIDHEQFKK